jgi:hypothetical protein
VVNAPAAVRRIRVIPCLTVSTTCSTRGSSATFALNLRRATISASSSSGKATRPRWRVLSAIITPAGLSLGTTASKYSQYPSLCASRKTMSNGPGRQARVSSAGPSRSSMRFPYGAESKWRRATSACCGLISQVMIRPSSGSASAIVSAE